MQLTIPFEVDDRQCFDNFKGILNQRLIEQLKYLTTKYYDSNDYMGAIIWGEQSSGKTHLLSAWAQHFTQLKGQVIDLQANDFKTIPIYQQANKCLYFLDDIELYLFEDGVEEQMLTLIEKIKQQKGLLGLSATHPSKSLGIKLADLASRLHAMDSFELSTLSDEEKSTALQQRAHQRGFKISDEVLKWMMNHISRDLGKMMNLLDQIDAHSMSEKRRVTIPLVKSILSSTSAGKIST